MQTYWFTLTLRDKSDITEDEANALFEAGCDDALSGSDCGVAVIDFARDADSLPEAVRSALTDVMKLGYKVATILINNNIETETRS